MIYYNVTAQLDRVIEIEWINWIKREDIQKC